MNLRDPGNRLGFSSTMHDLHGDLAYHIERVRSLLVTAVNRRANSMDACAQGDVVTQCAGKASESNRTASEPLEDSPVRLICEHFGLSNFERDILMLCAGMELDAEFAMHFVEAHGDARKSFPTLGVALQILPEVDWQGLTPAGPLRRWRLVELGQSDSLTSCPLRIDERILHFLMGANVLDERLQVLVNPVLPPAAMPASYRVHAERIVRLWCKAPEDRPVILFDGDAGDGKRMLAAAVCDALGLRLYSLKSNNIPATPTERDTLVRLWERESVLSRSALIIEIEDDATSGTAHAMIEALQAPVIVTGAHLRLRRASVRLQVDRPAADEQRALWENALGPLAAQWNGELDVLVEQFPLDIGAMERVRQTLIDDVPVNNDEPLAVRLWNACREQARRPLDRLAQSIPCSASWDDLVLPDDLMQTLREIVAHVRQRAKVYGDWGFAARSQRGLGISSLFAGASGTGKTMAAEVLACELKLDLYRIDLSQVVSKYIGETEKNLSAVFDAAEAAGAILLFDEADALFGKRSEVKDSHDRYANIEVSYLLQRMEAYRGLAILTTNQHASLDLAFQRRIRFIVTFPFPDALQRARIWQRILPAGTPTAALDFGKLARLSVSGGNIRNIALSAAFLAADAGEPVRMSHLLRSARSECAKIDKPLTAAEIGGWV